MKYLKRTLLLILVALYATQIVSALFIKTSRGDLGLVLDAATRMRTGAPLYDEHEYHTHTKPPITTLAFVPLSFVPRFAAERIWDLFLIFCFAAFSWWMMKAFPRLSFLSARRLWFLALAVTFNSWIAELIFGQFNLLLMMAAASAIFLPNKYWGGAIFTFSLFFKPTQIVFAPWIWVESKYRIKLTIGGIALLAGLSAVYGLFFGWDRLVSDHLSWWKKTGGITPMHVLRPDNLGLASFFTDVGGGFGLSPSAWPIFQILGIVASALVSYRIHSRNQPAIEGASNSEQLEKRAAFTSFGLVSCFTILASPMAWRYVYVLAFPFVYWVWDSFFEENGTNKSGQRKWLLGLALFSYFWGTQICNPEVAKISWLHWMFANRPPLIGLVLSLVFVALAFATPRRGLAALFFAILSLQSSTLVGQSNIYLVPSAYHSGSSTDAGYQNLIGGSLALQSDEKPGFGYRFSARAELETMGQKENYFDIDRTYVSWNIQSARSLFILGRVHPWHVSGLSSRLSTWGLLVQRQTLGRGLQLGYGWAEDVGTPSASLSGWAGIHFIKESERASFGVSFSPLYIPSLGPSADLNAPQKTARFGRRIPHTVLVQGKAVPLKAELSRSKLWDDVLLRPQTMLHGKLKWSDRLTTWGWAGYFPKPEPVLETQSHIQLTENSVTAVAEISPVFPQRFQSGWTTEWMLAPDWSGLKAQGSLLYSDPHWGGELGIANEYLGLSYARYFSQDRSLYASSLLQLQMQIPIGSLRLNAGHRVHLFEKDAWSTASIEIPLSTNATLSGGAEIFTGKGGTYFGEWRTNDRLFGVLRWAFERS